MLEIREVAKPSPGEGEVLVRVRATTVTRTDCGCLRARPFIVRFFTGLVRPKRTVLGLDFAGDVEAVGAGVASFAQGDRVFGMSPERFGAHAEYLCVPAGGAIAAMPAGLSYAGAVACEGVWYADTALRAFGLRAGQSILIYGASGAIGTAAVQLAKSYGAEVTAVVGTRHLGLAESLGADRVVDYTARDFTRIGETFDFVFDAVGKTTYLRCRRLLKRGGAFAAADLGPWCQNVLLSLRPSIAARHRVYFLMPMDPGGVAGGLKARMEAGGFRAVIDREYPFEEIADAYRYVEGGQKTGIVVVNVGVDGEDSVAQGPS